MPSAVLVTGGAGYVGAPAARLLAERGHPVVVLDDLSTGHRDVVRFGPLVVGDVADEALVLDTIRRHRLTAVLHFAAKALVAESVEKPDLYDRWNRGKTAALAAAAKAGGVRAIVFSSTCAVYGNPRRVPIPEDHPREPVNPYGRSKVGAEDALLSAGIPAAFLRYFNAAGAEPEHGLFERHEPETHLIPLALRAARTGKPIRVHGTDYATPDGTCVRDYVHVSDLAVAHVAAVERLERGLPGGAWNLGTGRGSSVREVLEAVARVLGVPVPSVEGPRRPGDPPALVADPAKARRDLAWDPRRSDLDGIVRDAAAASAPRVVAIDGPAGAGKSTIAKRVARDLGWSYLDTGAMYRAVTAEAFRKGIPLTDAAGLASLASGLDLSLSPDGTVRISGGDVTGALRTPEVTGGVSTVASVPEVRNVMVGHQRRFARENGRVVAEGRDIGTVVFPDAEVKIYLDADSTERARRRLEETGREAGVGHPGSREVGAERARIEERDRLDSSRAVAPLRRAPEAWYLDTTGRTLDEVSALVLGHVRSVIRP